MSKEEKREGGREEKREEERQVLSVWFIVYFRYLITVT